MSCECRGCTVPGCKATATNICGWPLGKKKKDAKRCHWCPPAQTPWPDAFHVEKREPFALVSTVAQEARQEAPQKAPLYLWLEASTPVLLPSTVSGFQIPKLRHVSGPCWRTELGEIKTLIQELHEKSAPFGWSLCYWSHEAMDVEISSCGCDKLRNAYFAIDPCYMAARADLF